MCRLTPLLAPGEPASGWLSALSFGEIDRRPAAAMITRANSMTGRGGAVPNGLGPLHAARPIGLPLGGRTRGRLARLPTITARTKTLIPQDMTLPSTRSAAKAVFAPCPAPRQWQ